MMKTTLPYPILRIGVDTADHSRFLRATRGTLPKGWSRDCDHPAFFADQTYYARYRRDLGDDAPKYNLYVLRTDPNTLSVVSIVPDHAALSVCEYQDILDDFRSSVLNTPSACHFPVAIVEPASVAACTPAPEVGRLLERWSPSLNNGAGFHPFDPTEWQYLLIALHLTKRGLRFEWFVDWFHLKYSLQPDALTRLEEDFYSSLSFLNRYDQCLDLQGEAKLKRNGAGPSINHQPSTN